MGKKYRATSTRRKKDTDETKPYVTGVRLAAEKIEPWLPWGIAVIYFIVMTYITFRYHRIGGLGVETDFFAEFVPQAKKLLEGQFSPLNYGTKGPMYSILLAGMYLVVRDYFYAGLLLNMFSSSIFLVTLYFLIKRVFNTITAAVVTIAVIFNVIFLGYTYRACSDMPFMMMSVLSMYFLFRKNGLRDIVISAVLASTAFLIRYNGIFIVLGSLLYLGVIGGSVRERLKRETVWIIVFITVGLPWFIPNWIATGSPVHNDNYMNVLLEYYAHGENSVTYENWTDALPREFSGMGDVILYDPLHFLRHMAGNIAGNFTGDMRYLVGWHLGVFVILGLVFLVFARKDRQKLVYFSFGLFYFLILTLVFYNVRFSLYLLIFYIPCAAWPFWAQNVQKRLGSFSRITMVIFSLIVFFYAYMAPEEVSDDFKQAPYYLPYLKDFGINLGKIESDKSKKIMARVPHAAYYAGLQTHMFPENLRSIEELVIFCREYGIDYILYSGLEFETRPYLRDLMDIKKVGPVLEEIYNNRFGVIYRIKDVQER